jgi:hypothetical protein
MDSDEKMMVHQFMEEEADTAADEEERMTDSRLSSLVTCAGGGSHSSALRVEVCAKEIEG